MTILKVRHQTSYRYTRPVRFGTHRLMFRPRDSQDQRLISAELEVWPRPSDVHWIHDVFGNCITIVDFNAPAADELRFESSIVLEHTPSAPPHFRTDQRARLWPFEYDGESAIDLAPYLRPHYPSPEVEAFARRFAGSGGETETGHLLLAMTAGIRESIAYARRSDPGTQLPLATLTSRRGTCRDLALLMIECCRSLGLAARFVTGYIYVPARDGPVLRGGGATHAWVQVFLPGAGWVEFDPTNGIVGNRDLIRVGVARMPGQARPLAGSFSGTAADTLGMSVEVLVSAEKPAPRRAVPEPSAAGSAAFSAALPLG